MIERDPGPGLPSEVEDTTGETRAVPLGGEALTRRSFLLGLGATAVGLGALTVGQSFAPLGPLAVFSPRRPSPGVVPINRTAAEAHVEDTASDTAWTLRLLHGGTETRVSREALLALPRTEVDLPIACVEGWSASARWSGVRMSEVLAQVGVGASSDLRVTSLQPRGGYRVMDMPREYSRDPSTLVALGMNGRTLSLDHGYPARIMAPGRPGVLQTKWIDSIEVLS